MDTQIEVEKLRNNQLKRLNELLTENSMTRVELAKLLNVNKSTITKWFNGQISSMKESHLIKLSDYFNVNPWWLLGYEAEKEKETTEHKGLREDIANILEKCTIEQLKDIKKFIDAFILKEK